MAVPRKTYNVLFLCTGNSARSIMAEALLNGMGRGRFRAFSAGSHPRGEVHSMAKELLRESCNSLAELRSKSWDEFVRPGSPRLDFVFTVCDNAAGEACPVWPGRPVTAHWGIPDPAAVTGTEGEKRKAFFTAYNLLSCRISIFASLPLASLDRLMLKTKLDEIGKIEPQQAQA
ncbi:MAG TPA: arsenate reductase ArsC [Burkholderiales bacterium]|nr:arsenate reductase ArsC [Burkholderiales bacterium]